MEPYRTFIDLLIASEATANKRQYTETNDYL